MIIPIYRINYRDELVVLKIDNLSFIPEDSVAYVMMLNEHLNTQSLNEGRYFIIAVNYNNIPIGILENTGDSKPGTVSYKEIALFLQLINASGFIFSYYRPNGITYPYRTDLEVFMKLSRIFQAELKDYIIFGDFESDFAFSFYDEGYFEHKNDMVDWFHTTTALKHENKIAQLQMEKNELEERIINLEKTVLRND